MAAYWLRQIEQAISLLALITVGAIIWAIFPEGTFAGQQGAFLAYWSCQAATKFLYYAYDRIVDHWRKGVESHRRVPSIFHSWTPCFEPLLFFLCCLQTGFGLWWMIQWGFYERHMLGVIGYLFGLTVLAMLCALLAALLSACLWLRISNSHLYGTEAARRIFNLLNTIARAPIWRNHEFKVDRDTTIRGLERLGVGRYKQSPTGKIIKRSPEEYPWMSRKSTENSSVKTVYPDEPLKQSPENLPKSISSGETSTPVS